MVSKHEAKTLQVESVEYGSDNSIHDHAVVLDQARQATLQQHDLTLSQAFKYYRPAIGWSLLFSLGVIMAGFDPQLVGTLIAIPTFQQNFGERLADGTYEVAAQWQSAFNLGVPVGQVVGSLGVGVPLEKYGRRWTLAGCCIITCTAVALQSSATSKAQILVAELVNGVVLGAYPVIAPTYISEVTPVVFRGMGAAFINLSFVIGQFVASGILAGTQNRTDRWSYDIPFLCQFIFPIIILVLLPFCPESPWHLVRKGKIAEAEHALKRLMHPSMDSAAALAHIQLTTEHEMEVHDTATFADCFKGTDLRRTVISIMVYAIQPLVGNFLVIGYAVYFFTLAGLQTAQAFNLGVGLLAVGFVGTCLSWPLIANMGRRTIYNYGLVILTIIVFLIAILDVVPNYSLSTTWGQSSLMVVYNFFYDLTIGPLCFVIISETSSAKLRGKTIAISTTVNALINVACAVGIPYALNQNQGNMRGKLAFVFFGLTIPCLVWCFMALPETKGRTFDELDVMFERRVPTKRFKDYRFDAEGNSAIGGKGSSISVA